MRNNRITEKENEEKIQSINENLRKEQKGDKKPPSLLHNKFINRINALSSKIDLKRSAIVVVLILFSVFLFAAIIPLFSDMNYIEAYQVYLNDKSIGVFKDITELESLIQEIYAENETYYNMEISKDTVLTYEPVKIAEQFVCPTSYYQDIIRGNLKVNVIAWVIYVNNSPVLALEQRTDAQWVLEQILLPYKNEEGSENRFDIDFLENVEIKSEVISYEKVAQDKETALRIMQYGKDMEVRMHKVVSGESLYSICKSYGLKLSDIKKANPTLALDGKIYKGDMLIVSKINNIVNVKYTEYQERVEQMPYNTIIVENESMYKTQTKVQQQGVVGLRNIKANVTFINGSESTYEVLMAEAPTREPVDEILMKGTMEVPHVLTLAKQGRMSLPLKNYTITSEFGYRKTEIEGASTFHKGMDLAAPYGTPIYASEDGQVSFAGSVSGYGLMVKIKHDGGVETRYGHCSTLLVKNNQYVKKGEVIALVGSTGTSSGNHVHFEVRINGEAVDPMG
ncbi:MAG: peptidoglycan DD-metalloendopeptidase family protein [Eubacteriales bacterium]